MTNLTPKQLEVLRYGIHGLCNKEIASAMGLGEETIKTHVKKIIERTGLPRPAWWKVLSAEDFLIHKERL